MINKKVVLDSKQRRGRDCGNSLVGGEVAFADWTGRAFGTGRELVGLLEVVPAPDWMAPEVECDQSCERSTTPTPKGESSDGTILKINN